MPSLSQRGAVLIQVGLGMIALMALSALAVDYGVKLAARRAAQNAADAGALAGAVALSYDDPKDKSDTGPAKQSALKYALANAVWGESPDVNVTTDITFPPCPPPTGPDTCVRVDVFRNQARGNPLPTFFGNLVGVSAQGVRATATARVVVGDTTECLKPWVVVDRWDEFEGAETDWDKPGGDPDFIWPVDSMPSSTYDRYSDGTGQLPPKEPDTYVPPTTSSPGTGITPARDQGRRFAIKQPSPSEAISAGWVQSVDLPRADTTSGGAQAYAASIRSCSGIPVTIARPEVPCPTDSKDITSWEDKVYWAARGCLRVQTGVAQGPTVFQGVDFILDRDPDAYWDGTKVVSEFNPSPRIVPVGIMDVEQYLALDPSGSGGIVRLVNVFGFFIEGMGDVDKKTGAISCCARTGKAVVGRLISIPGMMTGISTLDPDASFLKTIILVR